MITANAGYMPVYIAHGTVLSRLALQRVVNYHALPKQEYAMQAALQSTPVAGDTPFLSMNAVCLCNDPWYD